MSRHRKELVLALHPYAKGIAFAAFYSPLAPVDWGITGTRCKSNNAKAATAAAILIERLQPDVLILRDRRGRLDRPAPRAHKLGKLIANHAQGQSIEVLLSTTDDVRKCFNAVGAVSRYEIAQAIAGRVSELRHRLPPPPKPWESRSNSLALFDAAALAMTYFCRSEPLPWV